MQNFKYLSVTETNHSFIIRIQYEKYIRVSRFLHSKKRKQNKQHGIFETRERIGGTREVQLFTLILTLHNFVCQSFCWSFPASAKCTGAPAPALRLRCTALVWFLATLVNFIAKLLICKLRSLPVLVMKI